jgi:hypothetical protein
VSGAAVVFLLAAAVPRPAPELAWRDAQGQTRTLKQLHGSTVALQFFNPN